MSLTLSIDLILKYLSEYKNILHYLTIGHGMKWPRIESTCHDID